MTPSSEIAGRWKRRALSLPLLTVAFFLGWLLAPGALPMTALLDLVLRQRWAFTRCLLFGLLFLSAEVWGVLAALWVWLRHGIGPWASHDRFVEENLKIQSLWTRALFWSSVRLFGMSVSLDVPSTPLPGPALVLIQHVSAADTLLPSVLVAHPAGLTLRYVLKTELLWDPCLDIVGRRLRNAFVRRGGQDREGDLAAVRDLARDLGTRDGLLVYPEGTRFTPRRREAVLEKLARSSDPRWLSRAQALKHVLPPRVGGVSAALEAGPPCDVWVVAHTGFEAATSLWGVLRGTLIGRNLKIKVWHVPKDALPGSGDARTSWLFDLWERVDQWVGENRV